MKAGGTYYGPLPSWCGHKHTPLKGKKATGEHRTLDKAAYPSNMNRDIAEAIMSIFGSPYGLGVDSEEPIDTALGGDLAHALKHTPAPPEESETDVGDTSGEDSEGAPRKKRKDYAHKGGVGASPGD